MRKQMKMILGTLMSAMLLYAVPEVQAATCDIYDGYNKEDQSYAQWSSPVGSYLSACADGTMMRVQAGVSSGAEGILVEYYDKHYEVIKKKVIQEELPIFGAFYESSQYYFILSGQRNSDKLADVECYRVTKYDKNWNRLDSVGLYDCNTTIPFNAGSARMDDNGTYLVIRNSHDIFYWI